MSKTRESGGKRQMCIKDRFERDRALKKKTKVELILGIQEISPIGTDLVKEGVLQHDNKAITVRKRYMAVAVPRSRLGER